MTLTKMDILSGQTFFYYEVFPNADQIELNSEYIINDSYCMNPSCECKEVILEFIDKKSLDFKFAIRLSLKKAEYLVLDQFNIESLEIAQIVNNMYRNDRALIQLFQKRYINMKQQGKFLIKEMNDINVAPLEKVKRNDPCPCGSGKKYKKCCGA